MLTFYFVCKNGEHSYTTSDETVVHIEVDTNYLEGLKLLRCVVMYFKGMISLARQLGRLND
jgi:hypothetical protein